VLCDETEEAVGHAVNDRIERPRRWLIRSCRRALARVLPQTVRVPATASFVTVAAALNAALAAQIPQQAQWEITFAQVEAAAGLSDIRTPTPETFEARLMERPWSAVAPVPFLRLVRSDERLTAQLFVFWAPRLFPPGRAPQGADIMCRDRVCVRPIDIKEQRDWTKVVENLAHQNACPAKDGGVTVCGDCEWIWIKTGVDKQYREQSCQLPGPDTSAGALLQLMKSSARAAGY
jgi:hypothetical protein